MQKVETHKQTEKTNSLPLDLQRCISRWQEPESWEQNNRTTLKATWKKDARGWFVVSIVPSSSTCFGLHIMIRTNNYAGSTTSTWGINGLASYCSSKSTIAIPLSLSSTSFLESICNSTSQYWIRNQQTKLQLQENRRTWGIFILLVIIFTRYN